MATAKGRQLAQDIGQKLKELKAVCAEIDETTASRAPAGRWSPKEILSHLLGPKESAYLHLLQIFLDKENPTIDLDPGNSFFSEERAKTTFAQLLSGVEKELDRISTFSLSLTDEQLARTACVPKLKESPLGEYPSLESMIQGLAVFHVQMHIDHMQEILQILAD